MNKFKKPYIMGPISRHFTERPWDEKFLMTVTRHLHENTVKKSDKIIAINKIVEKTYSNLVDEENLATIPFGVDIDKFKPGSSEKEDGLLEILYVGSLLKIKGVKYLLKALPMIKRAVPDIRLRIIGEGPEKNNLLRLSTHLKIGGSVEFLGFIEHDELPFFFQNCDVFCFPTLGEPFGTVVIEAMACGKPVIAVNIGGSSEIIIDGKDGMLVNPGEPLEIARESIRLLTDIKKRMMLGRTARKKVEENYSYRVIAERYDELYQGLLGEQF
jgi:glycosyltransferase involved in cell wall biosynthesis